MNRGAAALLAANSLVFAAAAVTAQAAPVALLVGADSATVGDRVVLVLRAPVGPGESALFPDSFATAPDVELLGVAPGDLLPAREEGSAVAAYLITAWRPGEHPLEPINVRIVGEGDSERTVTLRPPPLQVVSVLPEDTAQIEPRPPKDVIGPNRTLLPLLAVLALLIAAAVAIARWASLRAAARRALPVPRIDPGERALVELDRIYRSGLIERGEVKTFYVLTTRTLRDYLDAVEPAWGAGLTTAEIDSQVDPGLRPRERRELVTVLFRADRVKFARHRPDLSEPEELWRVAREWVVAHEAQRARRAAEAAEEAALRTGAAK
jgi:hypothetical protein